MFNKNNNNNTYLFPHDHHHHHHPPRPSVVDLNGVELFLHHHHHHHHPDTIFSGHHHYNTTTTNNNNLSDNHLAATNLLLVNQAADLAAASSSQKKAQTSKKDRHSKIFTSQGPRDRRVRLSIGIARKFFDLQEMLGFDKPSKTLDWLLTRSKAAIKDLIHSKHKAANAPSSSGGGGGGDDDNDDDDNNNNNVIPSSHHDQEAAVSNKGKSGSRNNTIKESRAKARARARERTREKMCIKQMSKDGGPCLDPFGINQQQQQQQQQQQLGLFQSSSSSNNREGALFQDQDLIQESVSAVKRKAAKTNNPSFFGFQQNVFVSRDNNYGPSFVAAANNENWDVCSFTSQSNMCAILEHQKFMNSSSNM